MTGDVAYALLKGAIDKLSGPGIKQAVSEYVELHPDLLGDLLGLEVKNGKLCVKKED